MLTKDWQVDAISGATAGIFASLAVCPLDVVKTRLQGQGSGSNRKYEGVMHVVRQIRKEEGPKGYFRGLCPTLLGMCPTWATYFTTYNVIKEILMPPDGGGLSSKFDPSFLHMSSAFGAGLVTSTVCHPFWVVKTRIQICNAQECRYSGTLDAFSRIWQQEGLAGLYKGLGPSLLGVSHITIQFPIYERLKKEFRRSPHHHPPGTAATTTIKTHTKASDRIGLLELILSASISKIFAGILTYPHEVVRTRAMMDMDPGKRLWEIYLHLWRDGGVRALYRGYGVNVLRTVPSCAVTFVAYESIHDWVTCHLLRHPPPPAAAAAAETRERVIVTAAAPRYKPVLVPRPTGSGVSVMPSARERRPAPAAAGVGGGREGDG